ncbi:MAG: type IV toxin-antitoxin system AbiEi family antitoxin domain-containing protein [Coriobacteriia bacterium]|nr:type IV toxin-antitoxin system AbiEi family antitoxin domain-containing protein [Coriobacteriia bacterium]
MNEIVGNIDKLREIALTQHGYATTQQALDAGVTKRALADLTKRNRLERVVFGVYRVPQVPYTQYDAFMLAVLWTGVPEAVISHETALDMYDVSDINPTKIFVTVATNRRIRRKGGEHYVVYHQDLRPDQIGWQEEIPSVKLPTAIEQCIESGVPTYLLDQAIERGRAKGLLTIDDEKTLTQKLEERSGR